MILCTNFCTLPLCCFWTWGATLLFWVCRAFPTYDTKENYYFHVVYTVHTEKVCVFKSLKDGSILSVKIGFVYFTFLLPEGIIEKSKKVLCSSQYYSETLCSLTKLTEEKWWRADLFSSLHSISFLYTLWISKPTIDHFMQPPLLNQMNRYLFHRGSSMSHLSPFCYLAL